MKKMIFPGFTVFLFSLMIPVALLASRPVEYLMTGCVMDGIMFSVPKGFVRVGSPPGTGTEWLQVFPPAALAPYEGKKIRVRGLLSPGDVFQPDLNSIKIIGKCDEKDRLPMRQEMAVAYGGLAESSATEGDWPNAWKYIDKALNLDESICSLYSVRAKFYQNEGKFAEAVKDAQQAVRLGCNRYPELAFLAELLEQVGNKPAAIAAYEQAVAVCAYTPDKDRFLQRVNQLKGNTDKEKKGSKTPGAGVPPAVTDPEPLPPPPPMPD